MKTYICEICGDAYLGEEKPSNCPHCGARKPFIKEGHEARPVTQVKDELSEVSIKNLQETLALEKHAVAVYRCMAGKTESFEIRQMYKALAKVESEHIDICIKLLELSGGTVEQSECADKDTENFKATIDLEDHAAKLYAEFAKSSPERHIKIMFTALAQAETDHIELIKTYL